MDARWKPVPGYSGMWTAEMLPSMTREERIEYIRKNCSPDKVDKLLENMEFCEKIIEKLKKERNNE